MAHSTKGESCLVLETVNYLGLVKSRISERMYNYNHFAKSAKFLATLQIFVLIATEKCSPHPSTRELLFVTERDHSRKP